MSLVGIPEKEQSAVFQTVAAVLHLGNVAFSDGAEQDSSHVPAGPALKHLEAAAQLLGVPATGLARALTTRTRQTTDGVLLSSLKGVHVLQKVPSLKLSRKSSCLSSFAASALAKRSSNLGEHNPDLQQCMQSSLRSLVTGAGPIVSPIDMKAATDNRDSLAKTLYSRMFDWLVEKVNTSIGQDPNAVSLVGVLDIYGTSLYPPSHLFCSSFPPSANLVCRRVLSQCMTHAPEEPGAAPRQELFSCATW